MRTEPTQIENQVLVIQGQLAGPSFIPWIERHARRLGLSSRHTFVSPERIELEVQGPAELIDALEVGCLLGPMDVWVDSIDRAPEAPSL
ncbi:acylphosphatase [Shimia thalassica]|uniref:acylphosphatase n=1 Tax=Shimia thalassica TaxID=1715693 RepID=UPI001C0A5073|nr:acylphosphatase [Shimia thalassica]MBU2942671.1 acylphosphatase [Shimia thalassica]MDO6504602.1 acylphosphatase [Shimia thalassica]